MHKDTTQICPEISRKRNGVYRYESESKPDIAHDRSSNSEDEKLLTMIGMADKITSYNKAVEYDRPFSKYSKNKKTKNTYDWRAECYKTDEGIK